MDWVGSGCVIVNVGDEMEEGVGGGLDPLL